MMLFCSHQSTISQLPQIVSWPMDGGAFVTLPQVYSQDPDNDKVLKSNLGMYQLFSYLVTNTSKMMKRSDCTISCIVALECITPNTMHPISHLKYPFLWAAHPRMPCLPSFPYQRGYLS